VTKLKASCQWWVREAIQDAATKVFAVTAGLGSGKTHGECQCHHDRVLKNKSRFSFFMMPTHQKIRDAAVPTYEKVLAQQGYVEGVHYDIVKSPSYVLRYCNGREVHFISGNTPKQLVATEYGHGTIDEAGSITEEVYKLARTRLRDINGDNQLMMGGVPQGLNYYSDLFNEVTDGWIERETRDWLQLDKGFRRFRLTSYHNPFLPADYVQNLIQLYGENSPYTLSYVYGIFCALTEGNVYSNYTPVKHKVPDIQPDPALTIYLTMDFNACPLAWVSCQRIPETVDYWRRHILTAIHNADANSSNLEDAAVEFAAKHPPAKFRRTLIELHGDSSGHAQSHKTRLSDYQAMQKYLHQLGFERVEICAGRFNPLETETVEALNRLFLGDECVHCERTVQLQRSLMATRWRANVRKIDKPANDTWTHWSDSLKYLAFDLQKEGGNRVQSVNA